MEDVLFGGLDLQCLVARVQWCSFIDSGPNRALNGLPTFQVATSFMIGPSELLSVTSSFHEDHGVVSLCSPLVDQ
jgi:hypothetical protein